MSTLTCPRVDVTRLRERFDRSLATFLDERIAEYADHPEYADDPVRAILDRIMRFVLADGKRVRPLFCYWGWRSAAADPGDDDAVVRAAASLELFHSFALIHDDIMDRSYLRRGEPALHHAMAALAALAARAGDGHTWAYRERLGVSLAMLAGDLCAMWSEQMFTECGAPAAPLAVARRWLASMRSEVMIGQYLDLILHKATVAEAERIIRFKTARYTVTRPLQVGGALARGTPELQAGFERFGEPLGMAFQLRDDVLGVFGRPDTTGKPADDDLREGKPTVLIALAHQRADSRGRAVIDRFYGDDELDGDGAAQLRDAIAASGAPQAVEEAITCHRATAMRALEVLPIADDARAALTWLADAVTSRER